MADFTSLLLCSYYLYRYFYSYTKIKTMKKTTLLLTGLLLSVKLFAQVTPYTSAASLQNDFTGTIVTEDFTGGATDPAICGNVVSSAGNDCFEAGVLVAGFELSATNDGPIVFLPEGFLPSENETPRLGANAGLEVTVLTFTADNVFAVGHSLHVDNSGDFNYTVYDKNDAVIYDEDLAFSGFYGIISTTPIGRIEIKSLADAGELIGDLIMGTNTLSVNNNQAKQFTYYPNPVNDVLTIQSATAITSLKVVNMLGQVVVQNNASTTISLSAVNTGSYFVQATFENGTTEAFRVVKK